ncbi:MAG: hypothetical protein GYB67_18435 [Chloroflexi bacterium]|nr:hypothetical protein [Chloroflexota bacterium]
MPIITVQFIEDVVATPEQKRELIIQLTDKFVEILGDVVRPFVHTIIRETPQQEWGIAGVPMPDLAYLTGSGYAQVIDRANEIMSQVVEAQNGATASAAGGAQYNGAGQPLAANELADNIWRGVAEPAASVAGGTQYNGAGQPLAANELADDIWRNRSTPVNGSGSVSGTAEVEDHYAFFARWFEELWNKKNYDIAYELVDPDFVAHGAGGQDIRQGPDGVVGMVKAWHAAMPDGHMTMHDVITEGNLSAIRMTWEGTHTGAFGNIPPSGNRIKVTSTGIDRIVNGKITEGWGELDMMGMLTQMGAIPSPAASEGN